MAKKIALSFSGGKDSCLALYYLLEQGVDVRCLLTTVWKGKGETVAHEERRDRVEKQAERLDIPVHFIETDFNAYTNDFIFHINEMKQHYGIDGMAFGDIYLEGHRKWGEQVAKEAGVEAVYPLWSDQQEVVRLLREFIALGFEAEIIKVDAAKLPDSWVSRIVDDGFVEDILGYDDVCPMGESGEYHTYVHDGPIFRAVPDR
ncbi:diphthine--ammonia ligase [Lentibacillus sp. CBA3610]|uniref:Dph6-related ATP pyrophosphatase n=1 Tax=Lentibacillus sp. CBA3610 TaxID=2518176 RepID=UPI00159595B3|nr:diphthine--ammonia ligase [Lentibacillus sp. CBA3610]QKY68345.1 diphthine--ammonia ligase [Lentibacillus sp. CBA3610]